MSEKTSAYFLLAFSHILRVVSREAMLLMWLIYAAVFNFFAANALLTDLPREKRSDDFIPCENGWYHFGDKCYKVHGLLRDDRGGFDRAETQCKHDGGDLVSVHSKEELDFVTYFLMYHVITHVWIGLHRRNDLKELRWSDGSKVDFTHWKSGEPTNNTGDEQDCAAMIFDLMTDSTGEWNIVPCHRWFGYICQRDINRRTKSRNPMFCAAEDKGGWKFWNSCYHAVMEMKTWEDAEQHCQEKFGGHLATVLDRAVDKFLDYILSTISKNLWIGMKITDEVQPKWTSGWFITYNRTKPAYATDGTCVLRNSSKAWTVTPCSKKHPFLCEVSKVPTPVLKPAVNGSYCPKIPKDWKDLGGEYCYFFELNKKADWWYAVYECQRRGGDLLSIHSKEESDLLNTFIKFKHYGTYLGLVRQLLREDVFAYSDRSPLDFENWSYLEPRNEGDKCVELWGDLMEWNDVHCTGKRPYICAVKKVTPNITIEEKIVECIIDNGPSKALIAVSVFLGLLIFLVGVLVYYIRSRDEERRKASTVNVISPHLTTSYRQKHTSPGDLPKKDDDNEYYESMA